MLTRIRDTFRKYADNNAFCIDDNYYSYAQLLSTSADIAHAIRRINPEKNQMIGIFLSDDLETFASIFGIWFSGNTYVPLHPGNPPERNASIIEQAEIKIVLHAGNEDEMNAIKKTGKRNFISLNALSLDNSFNEDDICVDFSDDRFVYMLFTSGSTGVPKGVPITFGNLQSFLKNHDSAMGYSYTPDDRFLQMFDLTFDLSVVSYLAPLLNGACVYTVPYNQIKYTHIYRLLEEYNLTSAIIVPSVLALLKPYFEDILLENLRYAMLSGEAVPLELTLAWQKCCPNAIFQNLYGPTEATIYCVTHTIPRSDIKSANGIVSIGKPNIEVDALILSEENEVLGCNEKGELCLTGNQVTPGYWKNPEKNKESFIEIKGKKYYRTGDVCMKDEAGDYFYLGRKDHQVKIQGYRIELSEVEFHAKTMLDGRDAVASAIRDENGNALIALVIEGEEMQLENFLVKMREKLPGYMIPARFKFIEKFPLNANGKTDRKALTEVAMSIV
ncbi:MAG: AMP-binding protein [Bacteroidota bacterium]